MAAPITLVTVRGIAVITILKMAPEIFKKQAKDRTSFHCSDSYLQWLHGTLLWSELWVMRAAQKLPDDWEYLYEHAFLHIAYGIKRTFWPHYLWTVIRHKLLMPHNQSLHGPRLEVSRWQWLVKVKNKHSWSLYPSQIVGSCFYSKWYIKGTRVGPVQPNQRPTKRLQKWPAFVSNTRKWRHTGQPMRWCILLLRKFLFHTYRWKRWNWGYQRARSQSGRLTYGLSTGQRTSKIGWKLTIPTSPWFCTCWMHTCLAGVRHWHSESLQALTEVFLSQGCCGCHLKADGWQCWYCDRQEVGSAAGSECIVAVESSSDSE